ncbi:MAG TPA: hypothetical protein VHO69_11535 [Phototrophicaceae bacterium]|nr:hypothetical protein [Phototrophicaceae bacterium]
MGKKRLYRGLVLLLTTLLLTSAWAVISAQEDYPLERCSRIAFSTEEDFLMTQGEPYDGNPYVSDGDLLSITGDVCARNADLLRRFDVKADLGLDGVDVLDVERRLVAFSTELDSPFGTFSAGDILLTNGGIIPNLALVQPSFGIDYNIGLDEVKFIGKLDNILRFAELAEGTPPSDWLEGKLQSVLADLEIDIWFSTEGTQFNPDRPILDGDILAASGTIIATNRDLLHPAVPAGLPKDGVDFGVDAFAVPRNMSAGEILERRLIYFSTEILYRGRRVPPTGAGGPFAGFTDGDILQMRGPVVMTNQALIQAFGPRADFLGLDALYVGLPNRPPRDPHIQTTCGYSIGEFNGGLVSIGGSGTGLRETPLTSPPALTNTLHQPCGAFVPIDGYLPLTGVRKFRVAYRETSEPPPAAPGTSDGIQTNWNLLGFNPISGFCEVNTTLNTDADGWMDAVNYLEAKTGNDMNGDSVEYTDGCVNAELRLAVWDTFSLPAGTPAGDPVAGHDREDHYVVWLEWEDLGGTLHRESVEHHIQLDNTVPQIAPFPDGLQVRLTDGTTPVPACGEAPKGTSQFQVWAQFADRYYLSYSLAIKGGLPPATASYGPHYYYDPDDGSGFKATDDTGTVPDATTVHVRDIDMTDLGDSFTDCCYLLEMVVRDSAIRHQFIGNHIVNDNSGSYYSYSFITFAAAP